MNGTASSHDNNFRGVDFSDRTGKWIDEQNKLTRRWKMTKRTQFFPTAESRKWSIFLRFATIKNRDVEPELRKPTRFKADLRSERGGVSVIGSLPIVWPFFSRPVENGPTDPTLAGS